jgi:hypothetical protein
MKKLIFGGEVIAVSQVALWGMGRLAAASSLITAG